MADQKRWFKLWYSALSDEHLQRLPISLRWAWVALGVYTKVHGTGGVVEISPANGVLCACMGVEPKTLIATLGMLPNIYIGTHPVRFPHGHEKDPVCEGQFVRGSYPPIVRGSDPLEEWCERNGSIIVTWHNWHKYQEDSTGAERSAALRSKRRGEEKRIRREKKEPPIIPHELNGNSPEDILSWLNDKAGKNFHADETNLNLIRDRLKSGIRPEQLKAIVSRKVREWKGTEQEVYLRPATLFNKTKCSQYLGELPRVEEPNGMP